MVENVHACEMEPVSNEIRPLIRWMTSTQGICNLYRCWEWTRGIPAAMSQGPGFPKGCLFTINRQSMQCEACACEVVNVFNVKKWNIIYKKYLFRNNIGGSTLVSGICDDLCMSLVCLLKSPHFQPHQRTGLLAKQHIWRICDQWCAGRTGDFWHPGAESLPVAKCSKSNN